MNANEQGRRALYTTGLVRRVAQGARPRFTLLETIREFGREQLAAHGELERLREAHAAWCLTMAEEAEPRA